MPENKRKYLINTLIIGVCSFLSQILGLLRTTLLSSFYGATEGQGLADCYAAAFKLPDIIYTLVVSGVISIILIPYFISKMKNQNMDIVNKTCSGFANLFFLLITFFLLIGFVIAPIIVKNFLLTGWDDTEKIALTIKMTRIIFLQVLFITLSSVFGSYLNAIERFKAYSLAMLSYNVGIIIGIIFLAPIIGIEGVAWGVVFGGFLHFIIQLIGSIKNGFRYSVQIPKIDKELINLTLNAIPRIVTLGSAQIVRFFIVNIGSFIFSGAIFIFDNVENIAMVPYGLVAISVSTTAFPIFINYYHENDFQKLFSSLFDKIRMLFYFILPMSILMIILREEIVDILVGYKKFLPKDVLLTSDALGVLMFGIPFFSATLILVKFYYAIRRSLTPMFIAVFASFFSILISYILAKRLQISGLSIGRGVGYLIQFVFLTIFLIPIFFRKIKLESKNIKPILDILKIFIVSSVLLIIGLITEKYFVFYFHPKINSIIKILSIGIIISTFYFIFSIFLKIPDSKIVLGILRKKH